MNDPTPFIAEWNRRHQQNAGIFRDFLETFNGEMRGSHSRLLLNAGFVDSQIPMIRNDNGHYSMILLGEPVQIRLRTIREHQDDATLIGVIEFVLRDGDKEILLYAATFDQGGAWRRWGEKTLQRDGGFARPNGRFNEANAIATSQCFLDVVHELLTTKIALPPKGN